MAGTPIERRAVLPIHEQTAPRPLMVDAKDPDSVPHHCALRTDSSCVVDRSQPSHGQHGCDHRDRHQRTGTDVDPPEGLCPLAETLRLNGYSTAQFGKCHEVPVWQASPMGPFDNGPTSSGFEYFYGFIGGERISTSRRCS